jgi:hypothetical protein
MTHKTNAVYNKMLTITESTRLSRFRTSDMVEFTFCNSGTQDVRVNEILLANSGARGIQSNSVLINFITIDSGEKDETDYQISFVGGAGIPEIYVFCKCVTNG